MKYRSNLLAALTSALLVIVLHFYGCAAQSPQPLSQPLNQPKTSEKQPNTSVKIANFKYEPATLKINLGETVSFVNSDEEPHTVTSKDGVFNSKGLDTNQPWTYTFTHPGTFPYFCTIHPYMKGTVVVTAIGGKK